MTPEQKWAAALVDVIAGRKPAEVAPIVGVSVETVRRWLRGDTVPCGWMWRALVIKAKREDQWGELSAARDAVARSAGRPRLADEEVARRAVERRNKKEVRRGKAD